LIDDDGTVLLGDLGVAADLAEDTSQLLGASLSRSEPSAPQISNSLANVAAGSTKRVVLFDHTVPVIGRPKMGKRKSFVGTVRFSTWPHWLLQLKLRFLALLDGARAHSRSAV
jgi:serine/threonine-protein kinase OSR1/STK39